MKKCLDRLGYELRNAEKSLKHFQQLHSVRNNAYSEAKVFLTLKAIEDIKEDIETVKRYNETLQD